MTQHHSLLIISQQPWSTTLDQADAPWRYWCCEDVPDNSQLQLHHVALIVIDTERLSQPKNALALQALLQQPVYENLKLVLHHTQQMPNAEQVFHWINQFSPDAIIPPNSSNSEITQLIRNKWPIHQQQTAQQRWLEKQLAAQVAQIRANFFDYTALSDQQLSDKVISALYGFFQDNDEDHLCRTYSANHVLTQEGKANRFLWFIAKGEVVLKKQQGQHILEVARMQAGSLVGGMSFVTGELGFTSAVTTQRTDVIKLDRATFAKVLDSSSQLLPLFTNLLLRHFNRRLQKSIHTKLTLQSTLNSLDSAHEQLIEKEKMAVLGQLISGIAHELNNPVAAIIRGSDTIAKQLPTVLYNELTHPQQQLGHELLKAAFTLKPMSTSEIRQRSKNSTELFGDAITARKAVTIGLDGPSLRQQYLECSDTLDNSQLIATLASYHQIGNFLRNIQVCASRIAELVKGLKHYAGRDPEQPVLADLNEGIAETLVILENRLRGFEVECSYGLLPVYRCHPIALQQVWTNLIANALDAMGTHGKLSVSSQYIEASPRYISICIEDNGPGIKPEIIEKIFQLNFTTKRESNFGLGIGLTVCQQIVAQHLGRIEVESELGQFTRFIITLPLNQT
ncbi:ATP-binding protein [Agarivorans sp. 1_MG-2023]|uniref:ATP-binding protein n=1 Tax=Agarivorans sp. 1_MG-2023 TaxID=3062634 RepID=UPI0026E260C3|nr:ATP-binding protein [Agarivorans sp. 1_MG-2023]MDO6763491.1 ATP-binding protein [Agarivorans sp. 1_MG-2023]